MNSGISPNLCRSSGRTSLNRLRSSPLLCSGAPKPMPCLPTRLRDDVFEPRESAGDDEQHVRGVDLDELLVRVLASALRRNRGDRALEDLQQRLLHALARDVARDRGVLGLAGDLVDLVDVDDAGLGALRVEVGGLDQLQQDVLDVFADVARLGERCRVGDGERHVEPLGERLREIGLAAAGRADQQDVALGDLDLVGALLGALHGAVRADALVVVVDRDRQGALGGLLPDHVLLEEREDLARLGQVEVGDDAGGGLGHALFDDLVAQLDALVADVDARPRDQLLDLLLALSAEGALEQVGALTDARHQAPPRGSGRCPVAAARSPAVLRA